MPPPNAEPGPFRKDSSQKLTEKLTPPAEELPIQCSVIQQAKSQQHNSQITAQIVQEQKPIEPQPQVISLATSSVTTSLASHVATANLVTQSMDVVVSTPITSPVIPTACIPIVTTQQQSTTIPHNSPTVASALAAVPINASTFSVSPSTDAKPLEPKVKTVEPVKFVGLKSDLPRYTLSVGKAYNLLPLHIEEVADKKKVVFHVCYRGKSIFVC